jgi:hypothetical protein
VGFGDLAGADIALFGIGADAAEAQKPKPKPVKSAPQAAPECGWIGKRIIQLLSRDDVVAAGEFRQFYVSFGCSEAHLGAAFGCAVEGATGADSCAARPDCVDLCWRTPSASTLDKRGRPAPAPTDRPAIRLPARQGGAARRLAGSGRRAAGREKTGRGEVLGSTLRSLRQEAVTRGGRFPPFRSRRAIPAPG